MPVITKPVEEIVGTTSPKATAASQSKFISMQMTPNPLIKNSFASPVKEFTGNKY